MEQTLRTCFNKGHLGGRSGLSLVLTLVALACTPKGAAPAPTNRGEGTLQTALTPAEAERQAKAKASQGKLPTIASNSGPSDQTGNRAGVVPPNFQGKSLIALSTSFYRPIYLDLAKEVWAGFNAISDKFVAGYSLALGNKKLINFISSTLARPAAPNPLALAILQPLPGPWLPPTSETAVWFSSVGFIASAGSGGGAIPQGLVLADSPWATGSSALQAPQDYRAVYAKEYPLLLDVIKDCSAKLNAWIQDEAVKQECEAVIEKAELTSYNETTKNAKNAFSDLYQKRSVKIWHPQCPEGFAALGDLATNGRMDKPYSENDFSQGPFAMGSTPGEKMAMYCVAKKFLKPGKLGPLIFKEAREGGLELYGIVASSDEGLAGAGLFVARQGAAPLPAELWVLDRRVVALITE